MKKKYALLAMGAFLFFMGIFYIQDVDVEKKQEKQLVVAIDVGHGGFDPGKVGVSDSLEKDINLAIAKKLRRQLERAGANVVMTRDSDMDLCVEGQGKKNSDLKSRVDIINNSGAQVAVSIHQNSFSDGSVHGCQVFYYEGSEAGANMAKEIQNGVLASLQDENRRKEKGNTSYYILKNIHCPAVIVECGFLSNEREEALLLEEDYQEKMAKGICDGILKYVAEMQK